MGGLVSAVILAKEGYKVCVLEKNNQFGGNLQTFVRDKTIFDTGVHYIGGLDKGQNLYRFFDYLGVLEHLSLERMNMDAYDIITFDDDTIAYPHAQGYENFINQLGKHFPDEIDKIRKYCDKIQDVCSKFPLYNLENNTLYDLNILSLNLKDYLDELTDNERLKAVLVSSNLLYSGDGETTPFYIHALSVNSYINSSWRCLRGGSQIAKALVRELRRLDGNILRRTEVTKFLYENNQLIGVESQQGDQFFGQKFISNIDLNRTIQLAGDSIYKKSFRRRVKELQDTPSSFSVHIVLKPESFPYFNYNIFHIKESSKVWNATKFDINDWPKAYMISMGASRKNMEFAESLSILTHMDYNRFKKWEETTNTIVNKNERGKSYEKLKAEYIEIILSELENKYPKIREAIHSVHATTPLTYRDYIGGRNGNMYGFLKDSHAPLNAYFSPKTKIDNLFVTGQTVNMHGIMGVTIGAVNTCCEIVGREKLIGKISRK